jgi:hypothetical protein
VGIASRKHSKGKINTNIQIETWTSSKLAQKPTNVFLIHAEPEEKVLKLYL